MRFEETININASRKQIFSIYADVSSWPSWDTETLSATIDGAFETGTTGKLKPTGEPETAIEIIEVTKDESFIVECKLPLCKIQFIHELECCGEGTDVKNRVVFSGMLAPLFGRLFGVKIKNSMRLSLRELKAHIEKQS